jgi:hypothetical protein
MVGEMNINPDHALRACREFVSKKVIPEDLSISPQALAATLEAMGHSELNGNQRQARVQACVELRFLNAAEA